MQKLRQVTPRDISKNKFIEVSAVMQLKNSVLPVYDSASQSNMMLTLQSNALPSYVMIRKFWHRGTLKYRNIQMKYSSSKFSDFRSDEPENCSSGALPSLTECPLPSVSRQSNGLNFTGQWSTDT